MEQALTANTNLAKVLLGRTPKRAANLGAATPGSREEAYGYVQTYGDAWDAEAKKFLEQYVEARAALHKTAANEAATRSE